MGQLFGRTCTLTLGTTQIKCGGSPQLGVPPEQTAGLALTFRVKKNLKPEPNSVEIKVWNLAPATRAALQSPKPQLDASFVLAQATAFANGTKVPPTPPGLVPVQLDVGYGGDNFTIFVGQLRGATVEIDGPNVITSLSSGDNEQAMSARASVKATPNLDVKAIAKSAATQLGVGLGNLVQMLPKMTASLGGPASAKTGNAAKLFGQIMRANGMEWSVQDGALQVMPIGTSIGDTVTAVVLSPDTGLIGSPSVDVKGIMKCRALIQPGLTPGKIVSLKSTGLTGAFRIEDCEFNGATWGADWSVTIHGRKW